MAECKNGATKKRETPRSGICFFPLTESSVPSQVDVGERIKMSHKNKETILPNQTNLSAAKPACCCQRDTAVRGRCGGGRWCM